MELRLDKESLAVYKALASQTRLDILNLLSEKNHTASELAEQLNLSKAVLSRHIAQLEDAGLIQIDRSVRTDDNRKKNYTLRVDHANIVFPRKIYLPYKQKTQDIRLGYYTDFSVEPTCGLASRDAVIGQLDEPRVFASSERTKASLLWLSNGYVEYKIPNTLEPGQTAQMLDISMELSSEYPGSNNEWPSDITFFINGVNITTWTSPGNYSDVRGKLTPLWWNERFSQYGLLKHLRVNNEDSGLDGVKVSDTTLADLRLEDSPFITLRIGVLPDAVHRGGLTIFGKDFGNHPQNITMTLYYTEPNSPDAD
ncbi:ArsR/SmtB family transcription factor [Bifidobacterium biavatii]|uniref:ArsR family transcriptional regulator n=1 Tax=Bifidobacterium biavatii DSM 23969 TaxID=1437608 RepID=A0A086ZLT9_9BIFI|nr:ArsR family transcriptional regulator [Bifidobacterium biavatii]KFI47489.1 ArsR family transcriptional regulator [Bifidobacterium biavatii DSM 23969]